MTLIVRHMCMTQLSLNAELDLSINPQEITDQITPSNVGVLVGIIFSHTPDEAKSGGLAKACVQ